MEPGPDGEIDTETFRKKLAEVAEAKPYLIDAPPPMPSAHDVGLGTAGSEPSTDCDMYSVADFDNEFYGVTK